MLNDATILQGFFTVDANGLVQTVSGTANRIDTANGPTHNTATYTIINSGTIVVNDNSSLSLASPYNIDNAGTIELSSTTDKTFLYFNQPDPILDGGGSIVLEGGAGAQDIITGLLGSGFTTVTLDNASDTISGAGSIGQGDGALTFHNDGAGTVDADLNGQILLLDTGHTETNSGLYEATSGGILQIDDAIENPNGKVSVDDLSTIKLTGGSIDDGQLIVSGTVQAASGADELNHVTVTDNKLIDVLAGATLTLDGGTHITGAGTGQLSIESGGELVVTSVSGAILDGVIVDDDGTTASPPGIDVVGTLTLDDGTQIWGGGNGTLTVESGGELKITSAAGATLDGLLVADTNTGAVLPGIDVVTTLTLNDGTTITGGTLTLESGANLVITAGSGSDGASDLPGGATISGVVITDASGAESLTVESGTLTLNDVNATGGILTITVASGATLNIDNSFLSDVILNNQGGTINTADSTIETVKSVLTGTTIVATGKTLTLNDETVFGTVTNYGTIDIVNGGVVPNGAVLDGAMVTDIGAGTGINVGLTTNAVLLLEDGATILNGAVALGGASGIGKIEVEKGSDPAAPYGGVLDGVAVTAYASTDGIEVADTSTATLTLSDGSRCPAVMSRSTAPARSMSRRARAAPARASRVSRSPIKA